MIQNIDVISLKFNADFLVNPDTRFQHFSAFLREIQNASE